MKRLAILACAFILACTATASCLKQAHAGPALDTLGVHLRTCRALDGCAPCGDLPVQMWPVAYQVINQHPELRWLSYVALDPPPEFLPRDVVPVLYGRTWRVPAALCFAVGGPTQLQPLPFYAISSPGLLWRKRLPCVKGIGSIVFVGYPWGKTWDADSATAIRLESPRRDIP